MAEILAVKIRLGNFAFFSSTADMEADSAGLARPFLAAPNFLHNLRNELPRELIHDG